MSFAIYVRAPIYELYRVFSEAVAEHYPRPDPGVSDHLLIAAAAVGAFCDSVLQTTDKGQFTVLLYGHSDREDFSRDSFALTIQPDYEEFQKGVIKKINNEAP